MMATSALFFDSVEGDRVYGAVDWARIYRQFVTDGYVYGHGDGLEVVESPAASMGVRVRTGGAWLQGRNFQVRDDPEELVIDDADDSNPRIDRVIVRLSIPGRTITVTTKMGTPAADPQPPELVRDEFTHELSLAQVSVAAEQDTVSNAEITDERDDTDVCGVSRIIGTEQHQDDMNALQQEIEDWFADVKATDDFVTQGEFSPARTAPVTRLSKDSKGIFTLIEYRRRDGTLWKTSELSGGDSPTYNQRNVKFYDTDGSTVIDEVTYDLSYDGDDDLTTEVVAS
jgi:hypothetical protein